MKIAVCVKQVPDSETRITLPQPAAQLDRSAFTRVINPYDQFAVEEAVKTKERFAGSDITVVTVGPEAAVREMIKKDCLAVGCDRAVVVADAGARRRRSAGHRRGARRRAQARGVRPDPLRHQGHRRRQQPGRRHGRRVARPAPRRLRRQAGPAGEGTDGAARDRGRQGDRRLRAARGADLRQGAQRAAAAEPAEHHEGRRQAGRGARLREAGPRAARRPSPRSRCTRRRRRAAPAP